MKCDSICICKLKFFFIDKLVECYGECCKNGKFFYLFCLYLKRMFNNYKIIWKCFECKKGFFVLVIICFFFLDFSSSDDDIDIVIIKVCLGEIDKIGVFVKMIDFYFDLIISFIGWLDCDII